MALIKKFRKALFGGYKRKDVENFIFDIAEFTTSQQEILNQKMKEIDDLNSRINDFEAEKLLFIQQIKNLEAERNELKSKTDELENRNVQLESELSFSASQYEENIAKLENQLDDISNELEELKAENNNLVSYADLADNVSQIILNAESIASDIIEDANNKANETSSNIIDINSARGKLIENAETSKTNLTTDNDFELLENEIMAMQAEISKQIEDALKSLNDIAALENDNIMLKSVGE